eukprot:869266-Pyramimonas_sp.AAC.1
MSGPTTPFGTPKSAGDTNSLHASLQSMRMGPQLYQASQATSPFASPRVAAPQTTPTWQPVILDQYGNMRPTTEAAQSADSMLGQQQWMHRQMQEAMESMRRDDIDLPNAHLFNLRSMCLTQIRRRTIRPGMDAYLRSSATQ